MSRQRTLTYALPRRIYRHVITKREDACSAQHATRFTIQTSSFSWRDDGGSWCVNELLPLEGSDTISRRVTHEFKRDKRSGFFYCKIELSVKCLGNVWKILIKISDKRYRNRVRRFL